ncbi:MAG TPA: glycosyltransferase family 4 protein [Nitrospirota bacterium]|nr:glycosyltransferase family 4 protein [Nitrospirota bacterium]
MRILFINNFRYRGGGEEFLMELLPGLAKMGATIGIVCRPDTPLSSMFENHPVVVYPIEKSGIRGISSFFEIAAIMRQGKYEIVSIQRGHDIVQAWIARLLSGIPLHLVYTVHIADFIKSRFLLNRLHNIVTISRYIVQRMEAFQPALTGKIRVIHHGINLDMFKPLPRMHGFLRNRFGLSSDTPLLSTSGSMWKNQIEFLDALVEIRKELPSVRYLLLTPLADMPQLREFKKRAADLGVTDSILWLDTLPKDDMPAYYADIDIAVSTFRNEGFGIWVIEALAMGTPVVAFDEGGVRDALEGCPAGVLVRDGAHGMVKEIIKILRNQELRNTMSTAGPPWVSERFSRDRMIEEYFRFFDGVIKNKTSLPGTS